MNNLHRPGAAGPLQHTLHVSQLWQWGKQIHAWDEVFKLESQISDWKIRHPDFVEGVRARLVDKDLSPAWKDTQDFSLKGILGAHPPVTNIESWNQLLKHYGVIN